MTLESVCDSILGLTVIFNVASIAFQAINCIIAVTVYMCPSIVGSSVMIHFGS